MTQISYTARICDDPERIGAFLTAQRVGVLGLTTPQGPYAVPVNFIWLDGSVYLHGMGSGRKVDVLRTGPQVCFTVYHEDGTVTDPMPCHADTAYMSVMVFGTAREVTDPVEGANVLQALVDKFLPGQYRTRLNGRLVQHYRSGMDGRAVGIFRIIPSQLSAKQNSAAPDELFAPSTQKQKADPR